MSRPIAVLVAVGLAWCWAVDLQAAVVVGDPANPQMLQRGLSDAYAAGARDIQIAPGTYRLPPTDRESLTFDRWREANVEGKGVTLIFEDQKHAAVLFARCDHLTFSSATLRRAVPRATQGKVLAAGVIGNKAFCDWRIDDGYPLDIDIKETAFNVIDPATRSIRAGVPDLGASSAELHERTFRLWFGPGQPPVAVSDGLVSRAVGEGVLCHADACTHLTLADLTLENGGFGSIFETDGGPNHFLRCAIQPGPRPPGATEDQLVGCGADGLHSVNTVAGPNIEECRFSGVFLDDCIAIHGIFQKVVAAVGKTLQLEGDNGQYSVGGPIRISDDSGFFADAMVTAIRGNGARRYEVDIDRVLIVPIGAKANNPDRCGKGYRIIACSLGDTRSRGILVKADDGLIEHCDIHDCSMSGISIGPEYYWNEANYCRHVIVRDNLLRNCNKNRLAGCEALFLHGDGAIGNQDIRILDNVFDGNQGQFILRLEWTDGIKLIGNRFLNLGRSERMSVQQVRRLVESGGN